MNSQRKNDKGVADMQLLLSQAVAVNKHALYFSLFLNMQFHALFAEDNIFTVHDTHHMLCSPSVSLFFQCPCKFKEYSYFTNEEPKQKELHVH